jgi:hypothetical protein
MNKLAGALAALATALVILASGCTAPLSPEEKRHQEIMAKARIVAASVDTAEKAWNLGYRPDTECVPGMGVHWIHKPGQSDSYFDTTLDEDHPEVILFKPATTNFRDLASQTFAGIEYVVVTEGTSMNTTATVPKLRGVPLVGPMPGHFPGMPYHAELHIYLLPGSESGKGFEPMNPAVTCPV